jgi:hypothetical protein
MLDEKQQKKIMSLFSLLNPSTSPLVFLFLPTPGLSFSFAWLLDRVRDPEIG